MLAAPVRRAHALALLEISANAEGALARTHKDHAADVVGMAQVTAECLQQLGGHRRIEGIHGVRAINIGGEAAVPFHAHGEAWHQWIAVGSQVDSHGMKIINTP